MRSGVVNIPREAKPEGIFSALGHGLVELFLQVREQRGLRYREPRWIPSQPQRAIQLEVRQTSHVVEVQSVCCIVRAGDVSVSPVGSSRQVKQRIRMWQPGWQISRLQREVKLGGTPFKVIAPFGFRV